MTTEELSSLLDLGRFDSAEEAGKAAKKARTEFYGVFAPN